MIFLQRSAAIKNFTFTEMHPHVNKTISIITFACDKKKAGLAEIRPAPSIQVKSI
jgi:hypothetical protein